MKQSFLFNLISIRIIIFDKRLSRNENPTLQNIKAYSTQYPCFYINSFHFSATFSWYDTFQGGTIHIDINLTATSNTPKLIHLLTIREVHRELMRLVIYLVFLAKRQISILFFLHSKDVVNQIYTKRT